MSDLVTLERLKGRLSYDPETGVFVWRDTQGGKCLAGWPAGRRGTGKAAGYMRVTVYGREYKAHRLAWFYMTGEWPVDQIDHINGDGFDNRWSNLRQATPSQNKMNSPRYRSNTSGIKGVSWSAGHQKWTASIQVNGKQQHLGRFVKIEDAAKAYQQAAERHFGDYHRAA